MDLFLPPWVDVLPFDHPIKSGLYAMIREVGISWSNQGVVTILGCSPSICPRALGTM